MKHWALAAAVLTGAAMAATTGAAAPQPDADGVWPLVWGVDDAGGPRELYNQPWAPEVFERFHYELWVHHLPLSHVIDVQQQEIERVDAWCADQGLQWICNLESANFRKEFIDEEGRDWFNHEDGRHFHLFPPEILETLGAANQLTGVMYDEAAHMQNCRSQIANEQKPLTPWIYDFADDELSEAADNFTAAVREVQELHAKHGLDLYTEHVFPVMMHNFARAGWTPATKILKENWSPAYIATLMGAALQYDTELWITPDLWGLGGYPGHSVEEYRSALLLAYHMGADTIYTENLAYDDENKGVGSLLLLKDGSYEVTDYGKTAIDFIENYVPAHPRRYTWRQVRPRVAIIRQPDACYGQKRAWLPDTLYGNPEWPSTPETEAWLEIWHLLSRGVIPEHTLSWHADRQRPYQVLAPLDGVVVFDHRVGGEFLEGVEVIFLTGIGITPETQQAVAEKVRAGATCIALPELAPPQVRNATALNIPHADGDGQWLLTDNFLTGAVREAVQPVLPEPGTIRYRFGDATVTLRAVSGDRNVVEAEVAYADAG